MIILLLELLLYTVQYIIQNIFKLVSATLVYFFCQKVQCLQGIQKPRALLLKWTRTISI